MFKKDIVLRWVQELAKVMAKLALQKDPKEKIELIHQAFVQQLELDIPLVHQCPPEEIVHLLLEKKGLKIDQLEFIANLFLEESQALISINDLTSGVDLLEKARYLFEAVDAHQQVFSFERQAQYQKIQTLLEQYKTNLNDLR